jgi:hypothetical protein
MRTSDFVFFLLTKQKEKAPLFARERFRNLQIPSKELESKSKTKDGIEKRQQIRNLLPYDLYCLKALLILFKQTYLIKTMLINLKRQRKVPWALKQEVGRRLFALTQTFETKRIHCFHIR